MTILIRVDDSLLLQFPERRVQRRRDRKRMGVTVFVTEERRRLGRQGKENRPLGLGQPS